MEEEISVILPSSNMEEEEEKEDEQVNSTIPIISVEELSVILSTSNGMNDLMTLRYDRDTDRDSHRDSNRGSSSLSRRCRNIFSIAGTAVKLRKFKVTALLGYQVHIQIEGFIQPLDLNEEKASIMVQIDSELCALHLGMTANEYLNQLKFITENAKSNNKDKDVIKGETKHFKLSCSLRFQDFRGNFRAQLIPSLSHFSSTTNGVVDDIQVQSSSGIVNGNGTGTCTEGDELAPRILLLSRIAD